jgi:hypothetical protein
MIVIAVQKAQLFAQQQMGQCKPMPPRLKRWQAAAQNHLNNLELMQLHYQSHPVHHAIDLQESSAGGDTWLENGGYKGNWPLSSD